MAKEHVLIVEDDPALRRVLKDRFELDGYSVNTASDGESAYVQVNARQPDLVVLDIMLPKINGYELCRMLRKDNHDMPILVLTAKSHEVDIIHGLRLGADDYVTKPFSINELLARAAALLRRRRNEVPSSIPFGPFQIDTVAHKLYKNDTEIALTPKEFGLLMFLASHPDHAFTRAELLREVWGDEVAVTERSVDRFVNTLRQKIEDDPHRPAYIITVRDVGYRFEDHGPHDRQ